MSEKEKKLQATVTMYLKERNHLWDKFSRFSRIFAKFAKLNPREKSSENQFAKINSREFIYLFLIFRLSELTRFHNCFNKVIYECMVWHNILSIFKWLNCNYYFNYCAEKNYEM